MLKYQSNIAEVRLTPRHQAKKPVKTLPIIKTPVFYSYSSGFVSFRVLNPFNTAFYLNKSCGPVKKNQYVNEHAKDVLPPIRFRQRVKPKDRDSAMGISLRGGDPWQPYGSIIGKKQLKQGMSLRREDIVRLEDRGLNKIDRQILKMSLPDGGVAGDREHLDAGLTLSRNGEKMLIATSPDQPFKEYCQSAAGEGTQLSIVSTEKSSVTPTSGLALEPSVYSESSAKSFLGGLKAPAPTLIREYSTKTYQPIMFNQRPHVYVVFEKADRVFVDQICSNLEDRFSFVLGPVGEPNALNEWTQIKITDCRAVLICSSPSFGESECAVEECIMATGIGKPFVCIQLLDKHYKPATWLTSTLGLTSRSFLGISPITLQHDVERLRDMLLRII